MAQAREKRKTGVRLLGKEYALVTDQPEAEVQRIAAYADRKLRELALVSRQPDGVVAVLTCMTLSEELLRAEKENLRLRRALEEAGRAAAKEIKTAEQLTLAAEDAHGTAGPGGQ